MSRTVSDSSAVNQVPRQAVIKAAHDVGAVAVSWTRESISQDVGNLSYWQALGMHGEMRYMGRPQSDSPKILLKKEVGAITAMDFTVVSLLFPYSGSRTDLRGIGDQGVLKKGYARIARYATGPDYHLVLPRKLDAFMIQLKGEVGGRGQIWRAFTDAVPTLERAWAKKSNIGFQGKNTMLIRPRVGSFFFIAEVVTSASIEGEGERLEKEHGCGACIRCGSACPTAALQTPYRLDARRCISYLTIEKRGLLAPWERRAIGDWLFGCDICQEVCPFNHAPSDPVSDFAISKVPEKVLIADILNLKCEADFQGFAGGTPLERTRRSGLVRNAICVAVNRGEYGCFDQIVHLAKSDPSPTIRATAIWGAVQLAEGSDRTALGAVLNAAINDRDEKVRSEAVQALSS